MNPDDAPSVLEFFRGLPEEDRQYLRDDVTKPEWAERFARSVDFDTVVPLVAELDDKVVSLATLYRTRHGWSTHVAELRISVARRLQHHGLGTAMARILVRHAIGLGLEKMVAHIVENQIGAHRAFEKLGFHKEAVLKGHVKDIHGMKRDLVVMANDVSHLWEAMEAMVSDFQPAIE
jgi:RimJ/RimL family protein N-acetyltransferase